MVQTERSPLHFYPKEHLVARSVLPIVITDADATLLDHKTYSFDAARPALDRMQESGYPVVIATSKTIPEVMYLQQQLGLREPFAYENGGGLALPIGYFDKEVVTQVADREGRHMRESTDGHLLIPIAASIEEVRMRLHRAVAAAGVDIEGFEQWHDCPERMITACDFVDDSSQSAFDKARAALEREAQEGFLIRSYPNHVSEDDAWAALSIQMELHGLTALRGGRFYQASVGSDKGSAVELLLDLYRLQYPQTEVFPVGLGDSQNDISLLQACVRAGGRGFLVANPSQKKSVFTDENSHIERLQQVGPEGWNYAVHNTLDELATAGFI